MLLFRERVAVADKFREWAKERFALECPENVLAFLSEKGALKEDLIEGICLEFGFSEEEQNPQVIALQEMCNQLKKKIDKTTEESPTVDVVEVVRCKNCKYKASTEDDLYCRNRKGLTVIHADDYCCYGEREEN